MQRDSLDHHLYHWISVANERAERYGFPPGLLEESLRRLKALLGEDYLVRIFEATEDFICSVSGSRNLALASGRASVDDHVIQVMDLVATISEFPADPSLGDKVDRLKRNSFWPSQFEMAMALRAKNDWRGWSRLPKPRNDYSHRRLRDQLETWLIACECAGLAFRDEEEEQYRFRR